MTGHRRLAMLLRASAVALSSGAAALAASCDADGVLNPLPVAASDAGVDAGHDAGGGGAPTVRRTVEQRNPFGNVAATRNLLWDGDFEWSLPFPEQYGWLTGSPSSINFDPPTIVVGPSCASGLKCASLAHGRVLVSLGVSSKGQAMTASVRVRPATPSCEGVVEAMHFTEAPNEPEVSLVADSVTPDERGYCSFGALVPERQRASYLYVENHAEEDILVDDAVLLPADAELRRLPAGRPASPRLVAAATALRPEIRRVLLPRDAPPDPVREAFAAKRARPR
jgi:hypothetical protein